MYAGCQRIRICCEKCGSLVSFSAVWSQLLVHNPPCFPSGPVLFRKGLLLHVNNHVTNDTKFKNMGLGEAYLHAMKKIGLSAQQ